MSLINELLNNISAGHQLTIREAEELLKVDPQEENVVTAIIRLSQRIKADLFNGKIFSIVPLYVTSICQEHCTYCNFRAENKYNEIERLRLSEEELKKEIRFLADQGLRVIELVYATDPFYKVSHVIKHIKLTHKILGEYGGGMVGINARPFSVPEYEELKYAGLDFAVLWQETYDEVHYNQYHPGNTEKSNYEYRVNAQRRMLTAGIENVGFGVLSGLNEWRKDWLALMTHVQSLKDSMKNKIQTVILGIPRFKPAAGAIFKANEYLPTDKEYLLAISIFNLLTPTSIPFINTRESWELCSEIAKGGGSLFTFRCRTIPGGYSLGHHGYQFPSNDFSVQEYSQKLNRNGLQVIHNWNFQSLNTISLQK